MDKRREEEIEILLNKMKEENKQYQNTKSSRSLQNEDDDDEEDSIIESKYNKPEKTGNKDQDKEKDKKTNKKKPQKSNNKVKKTSKIPPETNKKRPKNLKRPATATVNLKSPEKCAKKDKLAVFLNWQEQWKSSEFLRTNPVGSKEGRKLDLISRFKVKKFEIQKKANTLLRQKDEFIPPHEKRRDELRFTTRMKMISF